MVFSSAGSVVPLLRGALIKDKMRVMEFLEENGFESSNVNSRKQKWKIFSTYPLHEAPRFSLAFSFGPHLPPGLHDLEMASNQVSKET